MIIDSKGMRAIEADSGLSVGELMEKAGSAAAEVLFSASSEGSRILFLAGKGNNGGDAFVAARLLRKKGRVCRMILPCGKPVTEAAADNYAKLPKNMTVSVRRLEQELEEADLIVDAVFGFGFHGCLDAALKKIFRQVSRYQDKVFSIDINSGAECDTGAFDSDAVRSRLTLALDCLKPFHMLRKEHRLFKEVRLLPLGLPHDIPAVCREMNEELFFAGFPKKEESAYKGSRGQILLAAGSRGMAGAACLNILGARTLGAGYIHAAVPDEIYSICASRFLTPVFHPFHDWDMHDILMPLITSAAAVCFGSGAVNMPRKRDCMDLILQNSKAPVVLDAEALRLLTHNTYLFRFIKAPLILTPHIGEFAALTGKPVPYVQDNRLNLASAFAKEHKVTLVLKGPNTIVVSPCGDLYINQSGNPALAQAGSGDLLTGMITAMLSFNSDIFTAVTMAVWLHGYLADLGVRENSMQAFPLERYPDLMDKLFKKHGY